MILLLLGAVGYLPRLGDSSISSLAVISGTLAVKSFRKSHCFSRSMQYFLRVKLTSRSSRVHASYKWPTVRVLAFLVEATLEAFLSMAWRNISTARAVPYKSRNTPLSMYIYNVNIHACMHEKLKIFKVCSQDSELVALFL